MNRPRMTDTMAACLRQASYFRGTVVELREQIHRLKTELAVALHKQLEVENANDDMSNRGAVA